jgi:hypothetical protein
LEISVVARAWWRDRSLDPSNRDLWNSGLLSKFFFDSAGNVPIRHRQTDRKKSPPDEKSPNLQIMLSASSEKARSNTPTSSDFVARIRV